MTQAPQEHRSILETLADKTGVSPKVLLPDSGSEHGASPLVAPNSSAAQLLPQGRGNYQMMGQIAQGGMSLILKGHDTDLGRDVAVKVLDDKLAQRPEVVQRFVEEAQIGGQLQHPGIVPVYELGMMDDERPYFTMKLVKGRTLASLFQQRQSPADERGRMLSIFEAVCQTMAYAHSKGVLHRDLKPANIMVGAFREVQVVDWGLAKVLQQGGIADEKRAQESRASLHSIIETIRSGPGSVGSDSIVGSVMGTPAYMAPEQAQGEVEKLDERADVFSLGAILCELLTGAPPYEEREGEHVLAQAAHAKLDPARKRIENCGADRALIDLCLRCLTPARAARPANAEEVAKAVHDYLVSTEERARKAELEAVESKHKAETERRKRRTTLTIGIAAVLVLLMGGGSYGFIQYTEREQAEQTRVAVEKAQGEAIEFLQAGEPEKALAAAKRALTVAETGIADEALLDRSRRFVAQAEEDATRAREELELLQKDEQLLENLLQLRLEQVDVVGNPRMWEDFDARFSAVFAEYGVDLEGDGLVEALELIRERDIAFDVSLALDDWARLRRTLYGGNSEEAEDLYFLAMDLDPDPVRTEMREAIAARDKDGMFALAEPERLESLPAGSVWVLSSAIWDMFPEDRGVVYRMYDHALAMHPDNYVLQVIGGRIYRQAGRQRASLACRHAAMSLRPDDFAARIAHAEGLMFAGRLVESEGAAQACIDLDPEKAIGYQILSFSQLQLGKLEQALRSIEQAIALNPDPAIRSDEVVNRYLLGLESRETMEREFEASAGLAIVGTLAFGLLEHPNREMRNPQLVLDKFADLPARDQAGSWLWLLEGMAYADLGDFEAAERRMRNQFKPLDINFLPPPAVTFFRAYVYANLGKRDAAQLAFERGLYESERLMGKSEFGWERSDIVRWREKARSAMEG